MKYLDEMLNRYGFGDGGEEPAEARYLRIVYVSAMNRMAKKRGLQQRAVAYNRPGMHNSCMISFVSMDDFAKVSYRQMIGHDNLPDGVEYQEMDRLWTQFEVLADCSDLDLEQCVVIQCEIDENRLCQILKEIRSGYEPEL